MITPRVTDSPFSSASTDGWTPGPLSPPGAEGEVGCAMGIPQWMKDELLTGGSRPATAVRELQFFVDPEEVPVPIVERLVSSTVPSLSAPPLPELLPISDVITTIDDVEDEEASERAEIEKCVFPRKNLVLALIAIHLHDEKKTAALLPNNLWDIDNARVALQLAILQGDVPLVMKLVTKTAFAGFHKLDLSLVNPYLCDLLQIPSPVFTHRRETRQPVNFTQLALKCVHRGLEIGESNELIRDRTEVLKLMSQSKYSCFNVETDEVAMLEVQQHANYRKRPAISEFLDSWKATMICSFCRYADCSKEIDDLSTNSIHYLDAQLYRQVAITKWDRESHFSFSIVLRRIVKALFYCQYKLHWPSLAPMIACYVPWRIQPEIEDPKYPIKIRLRELINVDTEVSLNVSIRSLKEFSLIGRYAEGLKATRLHPGCHFVAKITDPLKGLRTSIGVITGIKNGTLYYRPQGTNYSCPLMSRNTTAEFMSLEPAKPSTWPPSSRVSRLWFCGTCLSPVASTRCACGKSAEESFEADRSKKTDVVLGGLTQEPPPLVDLE
eukprot:TRINITY_DN31223_c0_g1_i1.p1 TRINITY_DN31223_c0_g1~~TRINITY_DN31223_c0_g1_i1.p1  ORF type:complete len:553 (+),score=73.49 TRINITY_DN31223_c0_g1_i1:63-1721(+)